MNKKYKDWIIQNYPSNKESYGQCKQACEKMKEAFPELTITNGFAISSWGDRQHWWCKIKDGEIIDPTANQYNALFGYQEIDSNHDARKYPQCRCANCGEHYYQKPGMDATVCSDPCSKEFMAYLNSERPS